MAPRVDSGVQFLLDRSIRILNYSFIFLDCTKASFLWPNAERKIDPDGDQCASAEDLRGALFTTLTGSCLALLLHLMPSSNRQQDRMELYLNE